MFFDTHIIKERSAPAPCTRYAKVLFDKTTVKDAPLSMAQFRFAKNQHGPLHHHETEVEVYYCLQGRGCVLIDGVEHILTPGTALYIAPGKKHETKNTHPEDFVFLAVFGPAVSLDFIRDWQE